MTYRRRGVTFAATLLGLVAAATAFGAPAFARHSDVQLTSSCDRSDDRLRVDYTVAASEPGHPGSADLSYAVAGGTSRSLGRETFTARRDVIRGHFLLRIPPNQDKLLTLTAVAHWPDRDDAINSATTKLAHCRKRTPVTTTQAPVASQVPRTSIQTVAVQEALPYTGSNSGPLLAAVSLLGAGTAILVASRSRRQRRRIAR
jgi:LPXTG-motif cell wall-anchored protein